MFSPFRAASVFSYVFSILALLYYPHITLFLVYHFFIYYFQFVLCCSVTNRSNSQKTCMELWKTNSKDERNITIQGKFITGWIFLRTQLSCSTPRPPYQSDGKSSLLSSARKCEHSINCYIGFKTHSIKAKVSQQGIDVETMVHVHDMTGATLLLRLVQL